MDEKAFKLAKRINKEQPTWKVSWYSEEFNTTQMVHRKMNEVWTIRHKETKEHWKARSGKGSWAKISHAKDAWANSHPSSDEDDLKEELKPSAKQGKYVGYQALKFDEQSIYELINRNADYVAITKEELGELKKDSRILKEVIEMLYEQDYQVSGFHLNDDLEPLDSWFEQNAWV